MAFKVSRKFLTSSSEILARLYGMIMFPKYQQGDITQRAFYLLSRRPGGADELRDEQGGGGGGRRGGEDVIADAIRHQRVRRPIHTHHI